MWRPRLADISRYKHLSILKIGKAKAIRLSTLEAICKALECQPEDILEYKSGENIQEIRNLS
jgi:DNA-binding Xre family transcriptional regulator